MTTNRILQIVPAAPGFQVAQLSNPRSAQHAFVSLYPIVAWALVHDADEDSNETFFVEAVFLESGCAHVSRSQESVCVALLAPGQVAVIEKEPEGDGAYLEVSDSIAESQ